MRQAVEVIMLDIPLEEHAKERSELSLALEKWDYKYGEPED